MLQPSYDAANKNERVTLPDGRTGTACWYPQMGGYVGVAVVLDPSGSDDDCFDVLVWHDGDFPFSEDDRPPRELHHCLADQFIQFGQFLNRLAESRLTQDSG